LPFEAVDLRTTDGWSLRAHVRVPRDAPRGVAVLVHALAADKRAFDRPHGAGLASFLLGRGWITVALDLRGHGESQALAGAGPCRYDGVVGYDLPAACDFARWQARDAVPVVVVGHGLGGHAALAAASQRAMQVDAIVALASAVWLPELDPSFARRWARRLFAAAVGAAGARAVRTLAVARMLRGPGLAGLRAKLRAPALSIAADVIGFARSGRWASADGRVDYLASAANVRVPVLDVASDGDAFACPPACAERLVARCGGRREVLRVGRSDDGTRPPRAMGLVTSGRVQHVWARIEAWMRAATVSS
jgi:alpha-beta hydrolase superfamily lysophospholipase